MKFSDTNFREILNKILIIKNISLGNNLAGNDAIENIDSILCYCYIDEEAGISFEYLSSYNFEENIILNNLRKDCMYKFRFRNILNDEFKVFNGSSTGIEDIDTKIKWIIEGYDTNEDTKELRKYTIFDTFRVKGFPDDVEIFLARKGLNAEKLYVKLYKEDGDRTFGKLLNEPYQNFGVHLNDIIEIFIVKYSNGETVLIHQCN
jgi:hypothetical protein